ncbi:MAG: hypothetical protein WCS92_01300 [Candidatus Babeliales bacterium]|jgi:hypothetical protein
MLKKIYFFSILITISTTCLVSNLSATQNPAEQKTEALTPKTEDAFIKEFVDKMKSDKINYDGKTLTLYASSNLYEYIVAIFDLVIFTSLLGKSLDNNDKDIRLVCGSIFLIFDLIGIFLLYQNLHYDRSKVPFLIMNDNEIKFWDGKSIKWEYVDKVLYKNIFESNGQYLSSYYVFELCDKFLNVLFKICDRRKNSPISPNNLSVILEHYLDKNKTTLKSEIEKLTREAIKKYSSEAAKSA